MLALPHFHFHPAKGWINDPNGFCYFQGKYHLFYQYNPASTEANLIHWGHAVSDDLIKWQELPIALAPDKPYDSFGCWSGSATIVNGIMVLAYASVRQCQDGSLRQTISLAYSKDGIHFEKDSLNPRIDPASLNGLCSIIDFRDPYFVKKDGKTYLLVGSHDDKKAMILVFVYDKKNSFTFSHIMVSSSDYGTMFECPSYFESGGHNVLVFSPQNIKPKDDSFWNVSSSIYVYLPNDAFTKECPLIDPKEIDHGMEFYAPQNLAEKPDGTSNVMIAWMQMWGRRYYLHEINCSWNNAMTLPREVTVENGALHQKPTKFLRLYEQKEQIVPFNYSNDYKYLKGNFGYGHLKIVSQESSFSLRLFETDGTFAVLSFNQSGSLLVFDRSHDGVGLGGCANEKSNKGCRELSLPRLKNHVFDIYLDGSLIEIFVDDGVGTMSCLSYAGGDGLSLMCPSGKISLSWNQINL